MMLALTVVTSFSHEKHKQSPMNTMQGTMMNIVISLSHISLSESNLGWNSDKIIHHSLHCHRAMWHLSHPMWVLFHHNVQACLAKASMKWCSWASMSSSVSSFPKSVQEQNACPTFLCLPVVKRRSHHLTIFCQCFHLFLSIYFPGGLKPFLLPRVDTIPQESALNLCQRTQWTDFSALVRHKNAPWIWSPLIFGTCWTVLIILAGVTANAPASMASHPRTVSELQSRSS